MPDLTTRGDLDERRRVLINQKADFDFVDLCTALAECAEASQALDDNPQSPFPARAVRHCDVCERTTPMARFCMPCAAIAARVIAGAVASLGSAFFRDRRVGRITTGHDHS